VGHDRTLFLVKRPDEAREMARSAFVDELGKFLDEHLGKHASVLLGR
jgi:hypothetical protein